jgi:hypothetical protein
VDVWLAWAAGVRPQLRHRQGPPAVVLILLGTSTMTWGNLPV